MWTKKLVVYVVYVTIASMSSVWYYRKNGWHTNISSTRNAMEYSFCTQNNVQLFSHNDKVHTNKQDLMIIKVDLLLGVISAYRRPANRSIEAERSAEYSPEVYFKIKHLLRNRLCWFAYKQTRRTTRRRVETLYLFSISFQTCYYMAICAFVWMWGINNRRS